MIVHCVVTCAKLHIVLYNKSCRYNLLIFLVYNHNIIHMGNKIISFEYFYQ